MIFQMRKHGGKLTMKNLALFCSRLRHSRYNHERNFLLMYFSSPKFAFAITSSHTMERFLNHHLKPKKSWIKWECSSKKTNLMVNDDNNNKLRTTMMMLMMMKRIRNNKKRERGRRKSTYYYCVFLQFIHKQPEAK